MKRLVILVIVVLIMIFVVYYARVDQADNNQADNYDYLLSGFLGEWVLYQSEKDIPEITITFEAQGIGTTGFNFLYLDTIVVQNETRFFWAIAGEDFVTNGKGELLEYTVIKIWLPPESELISINILSLGDGKIAIFGDGDNDKMFFFSRPRIEV